MRFKIDLGSMPGALIRRPLKGVRKACVSVGFPLLYPPPEPKNDKKGGAPPVPECTGPRFAVKIEPGRRPQQEVAMDKLFERPQSSFDISTNSKNLQFSWEGRSKSAVAV